MLDRIAERVESFCSKSTHNMNIHELMHVLKSCSDPSLDVLRPAQEWLKNHECEPQFHVLLSDICHRNDIDFTVRLLAIILLKNGIDKYWRPGMTGSITTESKQQIRQNICLVLDEPNDQIGIQCAVIFAKIGRFDYPSEWGDLVPFLLSGILSTKSVVHQGRCILVLKHVIKMLSTKRLPNSKTIFSHVCKNIFNDVFQFWMSHHISCIKAMQTEKGESHEIIKTMMNQNLLTRMLGYLVKGVGDDVVENIYEVVLSNLNDIVHLFSSLEGRFSTFKSCRKVAISSLKVLDFLLCLSTGAYSIGAQRVLTFLCLQIQTYKLTQHSSEDDSDKFIVKCLNLTKTIFENGQFVDVFMSNPNMEENAIAPHLQALFQCLVSRYLTLSVEDLTFWESDAEAFSNEEIGESWIFNKRCSAEVLALTLIKKFPDILVPTLLMMLEAVQDVDVTNCIGKLSQKNDSILQSIFSDCSGIYQCIARKEAIYYMIGLAVYEVLDYINFEEWLLNKLIPEVKAVQGDSNGKLLHRRVLWLISQWAEVKPSDELRPVLYGFVVSSLNAPFDLAVRLTASSTVQYLLDDFEFDINLFKEYQSACLEGHYNLLMTTEECDTKMRILNVFAFLIERLGNTVEPFSGKISAIIPIVWEHAVSENHDMLKCSILNAMVQFVNALGHHSLSICRLTFPLIKESTNRNNSSHIYLLEDGLELWLAVVRNTNECNQDLFSLFENIFGLLEYSSESLQICFKIIEAYLLLCGDNILDKYGANLDESFLYISTDVRNECLVLISRLVCVMYEILPQNSNLVCLGYCKDALKRVFHENDSVLLSANFTLISRMVLTNPIQFWQLLNSFSVEFGEDFNEITQKLMKIWCDSIDTIVEVDKKKLSALALLTILSDLPKIPVLYNIFADVICAVVQILYDVCDEHHVDTLANEADQDVFETKHREQDCQHDIRERLLHQKSVAMNISLPVFTSQKFKFLKENLSEQNFMSLISSVNSESINQLQEFLSNC